MQVAQRPRGRKKIKHRAFIGQELNKEESGDGNTEVNMKAFASHADKLRLYPICNWESEES